MTPNPIAKALTRAEAAEAELAHARDLIAGRDELIADLNAQLDRANRAAVRMARAAHQAALCKACELFTGACVQPVRALNGQVPSDHASALMVA